MFEPSSVLPQTYSQNERQSTGVSGHAMMLETLLMKKARSHIEKSIVTVCQNT